MEQAEVFLPSSDGQTPWANWKCTKASGLWWHFSSLDPHDIKLFSFQSLGNHYVLRKVSILFVESHICVAFCFIDSQLRRTSINISIWQVVSQSSLCMQLSKMKYSTFYCHLSLGGLFYDYNEMMLFLKWLWRVTCFWMLTRYALVLGTFLWPRGWKLPNDKNIV